MTGTGQMTTQGIAALRQQRRATLGLLAQLDDDAWDLPCLPPWRVRDVVAHLVAVDGAAVSGRLLPLLRRAAGREDIERWNDQAIRRAGEAPPSALLADLEVAGERLAAVGARVPGPLWRVRLRTVFGRHPLGFLLARRVLDEWVHLVDVARACERAAPDPVPRPEELATAVLGAIPALSLPRLDERTGVLRLEVATGPDPALPVPHRAWAVDFGRRQFGPRVTRTADATVRLHAAALALLAEGRDPDGHGPVVVTGDRGLADRVLAGLAGP